jgi:hypothetical protein
VSPPAITISDWKPRESGTLRGFFSAHLPSGLSLHELMLHERDGRWWISFPSKPMLGADGAALRDERGKVRYGAPLIEFTSTQARGRFIEQVLEALRQAQPQAFAIDATGPAGGRLERQKQAGAML